MVKKYKKEDSASYALGATLTVELIKRRPESVRAVYVSPRSDIAAVPEAAREKGIPVIESEKAINVLSPKGNCFAIGEFEKFSAPISTDRHHAVLVNPSDSGNLGTVMRAAAAFDFDLAIVRPCADPFDPKTIRASMGAAFCISFECFDSFEQYASRFGGRTVLPFMLGGAPFESYAFERGKKYSLVFGNEATGLPEDFSRYGAVRIAQSDDVDSLNLSVAAAIAMHGLYASRR